MKVNSVEFKGSFVNIRNLPEPKLPEIAFAGRSNVGKSSLINCLINRKQLAKTSSTPGKTRALNYYSVNEKFYFVDLPGYGFSKVSKAEQKRWKLLIESYCSKNKYLKGVIQIIDSRHGLTKLDQEMLIWLSYLQLPILIVATKIDKLSRNKAQLMLKRIADNTGEFGIAGVVPFSKITKQGKEHIWKSVIDLIQKSK